MAATYSDPGARAGAAGAGTRIAERQWGSDSTAATTAPAAARIGAQRDLRFRRDVQRLHRLGARAVYELLSELAAKRLLRTEIEQLVGTYAQLDPKIVRAVGADRLPPLPPPHGVATGGEP